MPKKKDKIKMNKGAIKDQSSSLSKKTPASKKKAIPVKKNPSRELKETNAEPSLRSMEREELIKELKMLRVRVKEMERDKKDRIKVVESIWKSEERHKAIIDEIQDGYYEVTLSGDFTFFNDSLCRIFGYARKELEGMNNREFMDEFNAKKVYSIFNKVFKTEKSQLSFEWEIERRDGTKRFIESSVSLIYNTDNTPKGFRGIVRDITERVISEEAMRASELQYRTMIDSMGDSILVVDRDMKVMLVNLALKKWCGELGISKDVVGKNIIDAFPFLPGIVTEDYKKVFKEGKTLINEESYSFGEHKILAEVRKIPLYEMGRVNRIVSIVRDVSERKKAEQALRESEKRYRTVYETAPLAFVIWDNNCIITDWNKRAEQLFGWTRKEILGKNFLDFLIPEESRRVIEDVVKNLLENKFPSHSISDNLTKSGGIILCEWNNTLLYDSNGSIIGVMSLALDLTESRRLEEQLFEAEREFIQLFNRSQIGIFRASINGEISVCNPFMLEMMGCKSVKEINKIGLVNINPNMADKKNLEELIKEGPVSDFETRMMKVDGSEVDVAMSLYPVYDDKGEMQHLEGNVKDITVSKKLEEELLQSRKMESIGRLAGGVAHDLNNMLTPILGYTEMLLADLQSDYEHYDDILQIRGAAERARDLTRRLLAFGRKQVLEMKTVDLCRIVSDFEKMMRRTIREDVELIIKPAPMSCNIRTDPSQIEQILLNFAVNAQDAMPAGGELIIEVNEVVLDDKYIVKHPDIKEGSYIMLCVRDSGEGMDSKTIEKIFEPFFTTREDGTGLGLATVYGIVKQHNGNIQVESKPGKGTTFKIYFPRAGDAVRMPYEKEDIKKEEDTRETILIAEDEEAVRNLASRILEKNGYKVLKAANGEEAIKIVKSYQSSIDMLLTDVIMPKIDGKKLFKEVSVIRKDIKVLYMSGYTHDVIAQHGVVEKGVHFLQKPFSIHALLGKVREVLESRKDE